MIVCEIYRGEGFYNVIHLALLFSQEFLCVFDFVCIHTLLL